MSEIIDLTGRRFGRLTAIRIWSMTNRRTYWLFRCDCGKEKPIRSSHVIQGRTKSCGCLNKELARTRGIRTHGLIHTPEYRTWANMKDRCYRKTHPQWDSYGGAGIIVCQQWKDSFETFLADMGPRPSPKHSIDRYPNPFGNYEPANCRWATQSQQMRNRRPVGWKQKSIDARLEAMK